ncbi:MAG: AAA family ATPase [Pseudomonadota bacterium]
MACLDHAIYSDQGMRLTVYQLADAPIGKQPPCFRLPRGFFAADGITPGELLTIDDGLTLPALPLAELSDGHIGVPQDLAMRYDLPSGGSVTVTVGAEATMDEAAAGDLTFANIGGLGPELGRLREMVELPLLRPDLFQHLGINPPRGVLMSGPPGCGKTLIARALANETAAGFFHIAGPEIADKHFGASEAKLRDVFGAAADAAPAIIFIDEIDSIAPARETLSGDRQAERRMVAQLLTLMDGLDARGDVVVLAATNLPDLLDPALRRPGRFDREIILSAPDAKGRADILQIYGQRMPLDASVDLPALASRCHGFVGADSESLSREAAMAALRRHGQAPAHQLRVTTDDFEMALGEVRPSTLRAIRVDVPDTGWGEIAGANAAKAALRQAVEWPLAYPDHFSALGLKAPKGILLHGPPGTGKTLLARALASAANANFIAVNASELLSMYLGESERAIRTVFARARASAPTVLFFDELDALAAKRGPAVSETSDRVVAQLLTELDGLSAVTGIFVLAATNRVAEIDPAVLRPGRFDLKISVPMPSQADRMTLIALQIGETADETIDWEAIASRCDGFSGADIVELVRAAKQACLARALTVQDLPKPESLRVSSADLEAAFAQMGQGQ